MDKKEATQYSLELTPTHTVKCGDMKLTFEDHNLKTLRKTMIYNYIT